jgi:hypothetical protein
VLRSCAAAYLAFERSPGGLRDPNPDDLDRLAASLNHLALCCRTPSTRRCSALRIIAAFRRAVTALDPIRVAVASMALCPMAGGWSAKKIPSRTEFPLARRSFHSARARSTGGTMESTNTGVRLITPDPELLLLVSRWRARAQEVLAQAETMRDAEARQTMREIAARYESLAQRVEQQAGRADRV